MKTVVVEITTSLSPDDAFKLATNMEEFPKHSAIVNSVSRKGSESIAETSWEVTFRQGKLRWTERDVRDFGRRCCSFVLLEGDFDIFEGEWEIAESLSFGSHLSFRCSFDFGIPSMQAMLESLAARTLATCICEILSNLLADVQVVKIQQ